MVTAIIPARYASTRFPGKPLALLKGEPIIIRVVKTALSCRTIDRAIVATDDNRIYDAVKAAGFEVKMTSENHPSGTDRIAEVAAGIDDEIVVNIQGDEPMIDTVSVDLAVEALVDDPSLNVSTLCVPISEEEAGDPNAVKVVTDNNGFALYFSRAPIPFDRDGQGTAMKKHLGFYVYRRKFLLEYAELEPTELEKVEKLEQLRIIQNGFKIKVLTAGRDSIGIDTPEDLEKAEGLTDV
jgi:3-deoxy-manno-octulosonate cytidylyltransferase (CMP-KDO synthetase)